MGMFPKKVIGSSSESNASITFVVTVLQMLAPAYQLSAHDQLAQAYQLDNSQVTAGQTCILFSLHVSLRRFIYHSRCNGCLLQPRPQKGHRTNRRTFCDMTISTAVSDPGRAGGLGCDAGLFWPRPIFCACEQRKCLLVYIEM